MRHILLYIFILSVVVGVAGYDGPGRSREILRETAAKAEAGDPEALYQMSVVYSRGFDSIPQDSSLSLDMLRRASDAGHIQASNMLAYKLMEGVELPADTVEAVRLFEIAANAGDSKAQSNLGYLLINGLGVSSQPEKGAYWLELASEAGITRAQSMLGDLYRDGRGVAQDSLQAEAHYRAAFEHGLADAGNKIYDLRKTVIDTLSSPRLLSEALYYYKYGAIAPAFRILERLEESPDTAVRAHALAIIGDAYARQRGVKYDYNKSLDYLFRAAVLGNPSAQFMIGELLDMLPDALTDHISATDSEDYHYSEYWYARAAEAGVLDAAEAGRRLLISSGL